MKYQKIDIGLIDTTSACWDRFSLPSPLSLEDFTGPISSFGLINPLKLWEKAEAKGYWLVSDLKRLTALKKLNWEKVPAFVYGKNELTEEKALELALWEVYYGKNLSEGAKASFLARMSRCFRLSSRQIASKFAPLLRLASSKVLIEDYIKIGNFPQKWLIALDEGRLSLEQFRYILSFKPKESELLLLLLCGNISLNRNESRQFFELIRDLMLIKKCPLDELLSDAELKRVYQDVKLPAKKRGQHLLFRLRRMRYPRIHQAIDEFQWNLAEASFPPGIEVHHPANFEGGWLKFVINSSKEEELAHQLKVLHRILSQGKLSPLFKYI